MYGRIKGTYSGQMFVDGRIKGTNGYKLDSKYPSQFHVEERTFPPATLDIAELLLDSVSDISKLPCELVINAACAQNIDAVMLMLAKGAKIDLRAYITQMKINGILNYDYCHSSLRGNSWRDWVKRTSDWVGKVIPFLNNFPWKFLLENGGDCNFSLDCSARGDAGDCTLLMLAVTSLDFNVVDILVSKGADVNAVNSVRMRNAPFASEIWTTSHNSPCQEGNTALILAASTPRHDCDKIVRLLLKSKADVCWTNKVRVT